MANSKLESLTLNESVLLSSPHPYALLVSKNNSVTNIMGVSWYTFVSLKPGMIAFSISNKSYTKELITLDAQICLCLPTVKIIKEAFECGKKTGRYINKAEELGIELVYIEGFSAPVVADSALAWMLQVKKSLDVGDHTLYITEIISIVGDSNKQHVYANDGYKRLKAL